MTEEKAEYGKQGAGNKVISTFPKNSQEEVRTQLTTFKGHDLLDIRVWIKSKDGKEPIPTRKGLTISTKLAPKLKEAIIKAEKALDVGSGPG